MNSSNEYKQNLNEPIIQSKKINVDVRELLNLVGNDKTYQKRLFVYYIIAMFAYSFIFNGMQFLFYSPTFNCFRQDGSSYVCPEVEACKNPYKYTVTSKRESLVTRFNLYCDNKYLDTAAKNYIFFFGAASTLFFSILSDFLGRKLFFSLGTITILFGTLLGLSNDFNMVILGCVLCYISLYLFFTFIYVYTNEVVGANLRSRILPMIRLTDFFGLICINILTIYYTSYQYIFIANLIINGGLCFMYFFFVETPFFLERKKDKEPLLQALLKINRINYDNDKLTRESNEMKLKEILRPRNVSLDSFTNEIEKTTTAEIENIEEKTFISQILNPSNLLKLFQVSCLFMADFVVIGIFMVGIQFLGTDDIQLNITSFALVNGLGLFISFNFAHLIPRKAMTTIYCLISIVVSLLLILIEYTGEKDGSVEIGLKMSLSIILYSASGFVNTLLTTYTTELFPTAIRGFGIGIGSLIGRFSFMLGSYFVLLGNEHEINPMCYCLVTGTIGLVCALTLPETLNQKLKK